MPAVQETIDRVRSIDLDQYKYGFETTIEMEKSEKGISEDVVRFISAKKNEPAWLLEWRLDAYRRWLTMQEPEWARVSYDKVNYNDIYYYAAPKRPAAMSLDEIDPEILKTYEKLGIPLRESRGAGGHRAGAPRRGRCGVRLRVGGHHLQEGTREGRRDLHADLRGRPRASRNWSRSISARSCRRPTTSSPR